MHAISGTKNDQLGYYLLSKLLKKTGCISTCFFLATKLVIVLLWYIRVSLNFFFF